MSARARKQEVLRCCCALGLSARQRMRAVKSVVAGERESEQARGVEMPLYESSSI